MQLPNLILATVAAAPLALPSHSLHQGESDYLPNAAASKVVTVTSGEGAAEAGVIVMTEAVAIKETGPKQTVARFGEVYTFAPSFIAVHRDEPTGISFWNLQADDDHDFMLVGPDLTVMMKVTLPALQKTPYVFTFHREGLFTFYCTMHQPEMSGQVLVLPPTAR